VAFIVARYNSTTINVDVAEAATWIFEIDNLVAMKIYVANNAQIRCIR
jgi:hypothetical protein